MSVRTQSFAIPIAVDLGHGGALRSISSPREALDCLRRWDWPDKSGLAYEQAVGMSLRAISGLVSMAAARDAFVAAARRAHVLADEESAPAAASRVKSAALAVTKASAASLTREPRPAT